MHSPCSMNPTRRDTLNTEYDLTIIFICHWHLYWVRKIQLYGKRSQWLMLCEMARFNHLCRWINWRCVGSWHFLRLDSSYTWASACGQLDENNLIKVYPVNLDKDLAEFIFIFFGRSFDDWYLQTFTSRFNRDTGRDQEEHRVPRPHDEDGPFGASAARRQAQQRLPLLCQSAIAEYICLSHEE
jgi:hypothetical protein